VTRIATRCRKGPLTGHPVGSRSATAIAPMGAHDRMSSAQDNRQVQAPPEAVQSDIAALQLPEGPGLIAIRCVGTSSRARTRSRDRPSRAMKTRLGSVRDDLYPTRSKGRSLASVAKSRTLGAYFYGSGAPLRRRVPSSACAGSTAGPPLLTRRDAVSMLVPPTANRTKRSVHSELRP
jgi:hypothetical protein